MRTLLGAAVVASVLATAGCGDNSRACGQGTMPDSSGYCVPTASCGPGTKLDMNGQCVPDGSVVCTSGTKFDPATGKCVVDPADCQNGTVLINGACVDPTQGLTIDLMEGPEPNGLGIVEQSSAPAGTIMLNAAGGPGYIIHGTIDPWQDANGDGQLDPDVDTYVLAVTGPTLLDVTAAGTHGVTAGFAALSNAPPTDRLSSYVRFGINITGATAHRQVYLPSAGEYLIAIADSRTFYQYSTGGPVNAAPGGGNGDYYITIQTLDLPAPTPLTPTGNVATVMGNFTSDVMFYTVPMGTGINDVTINTAASQTTGALAVLDNGMFRATAHQTVDPSTGFPVDANIVTAGYKSGDTALIAADFYYSYAQQPSPFTLTVTTGAAIPLSLTGGDATQSVITPAPQSVQDLDAYYFDVANAGDTIGIDLTWNHPVQGLAITQDVTVAASFTGLQPNGPTWTSYRGLMRFPSAGRYYFVVVDPTGTAGTTPLTATSTIQTLTPVAIAESVPTGTQAVNAFHSNPFSYAAGTDPWQTFDSTGTATGGQLVEWLDPTKAFGRLDSLATTAGTLAGQVTPIFAHQFTGAGGPIGRILLDDGTTSYFVKVNPSILATGQTFTLTFAPRTIHDFGTVVAGTPKTATDNTLDATTTTAGYFLFRTAIGNPTTITVHPHLPLLLNTQFQRVNNDESARGPSVNTSNTGDDVAQFIQAGNGWTALIVTAVTPPATAELYDVTIAP